MEYLEKYVKDYPQKDGSFILCNIAGLGWQMLKDGNILSIFPEYIKGQPNTMIVSSDGDGDGEFVRGMAVEIIKRNICNLIESVNELAREAGYENFDIDMDYVIEELQTPPDIKFYR